jgi:hypothetical protein
MDGLGFGIENPPILLGSSDQLERFWRKSVTVYNANSQVNYAG